MKTTLNKIREHSPCKDGWEKLLTYLGKTQADDEPLAITTIIDSNGIDDALWCLRAVEGKEKEIRLFSVWCARQVQHLMTDQRGIDALDVAERYANGEATEEELKDASYAANAAYYAAYAAGATAMSAAWDAAWYTTGNAAYAARSAAWAARTARAAAEDAAYAALSAGAAAMSAAWAAAWGVSMDAAWGVWDEMKAKQEAELRIICEEG